MVCGEVDEGAGGDVAGLVVGVDLASSGNGYLHCLERTFIYMLKKLFVLISIVIQSFDLTEIFQHRIQQHCIVK